MKYLLAITMLLSFGCQNRVIMPPFTQKIPDTLSSPTKSIVAADVHGVLPIETLVKTDMQQEMLLSQDTVLVTNDGSVVKELVIPRNTIFIIPENTRLRTASETSVHIATSTLVILPAGTEISLSRINWYALLFYFGLVIVALVAYYRVSKRFEEYTPTPIETTKPEQPIVVPPVVEPPSNT